MLDMTLHAATPAAWQTSLRPGDIVLYRFPHAEEDASGSPKSRTCLVLDVEHRNGRRFATLAYGTSATTAANRGEEIRVERPEALAAAGLDRRTRFVGARRVTVSLDHPGFDLNPRFGTPVLGRLDERDMARMNEVRARIHALRDIAAERRRARCRQRVSTPGPVVVIRPSRKALRARIAAAQGRRIAR